MAVPLERGSTVFNDCTIRNLLSEIACKLGQSSSGYEEGGNSDAEEETKVGLIPIIRQLGRQRRWQQQQQQQQQQQ